MENKLKNIRKIQRYKGYSSNITLPSDWIKKHNYPKKVEIKENGKELRIKPIK